MAEPKSSTNWKVITLCFIGAATFWFFSALGKEYSHRIKHPIRFVYDTDSLVAVRPLPEFVDVDVSGGGWDLFKESFWFGSDPVQFELENPAAIRFLTRPTILPILTEELSQYRVNFLFTDTLFININRKATKLVALTIDSTQIDLDDGYRIISPIKVTPDSAVLYGPTSFLDTLTQLFEVRLRRDEIDENYTDLVELPVPGGFGIYADPAEVNVSFEVERFNERQLETTIEMIDFPEDSTVFVSEPEITISYMVQESKEVEVSPSDFKVVVDYRMINPSDSTAPAILIVQPDQALEAVISPDTLKVSYVR